MLGQLVLGLLVLFNGVWAQCFQGQVLVNGVCLFQVAIGNVCQNTAQCLGGSQCTANMCTCPSGSTNVNGQCTNNNGGGSGTTCQLGTTLVNNVCVPLSTPGTSCQSSTQCIDRSQCSSSGFCTCPAGAQQISGYCITPTGGPCQQTQVFINNQCVTYSVVGGACVANAQCVGGSTCVGTTCACPSGLTAMYGYCIANSNGGNTQCGVNQVFVNGQCMNTVQLFGSCQFTQQCLSNSQCLSNICQCTTGSTISNGVCTNGNNGNCGANMVLVNNQCFPTVPLNSQCQFNQQCLSNSQCLNNFCQCAAGSSVINGVCSGGSSSCGTNMVLVNGQCMNTVQLFGSCQFTQQCLSNSQCLSNICQCPTGSSVSNGVCTNGNNGNCGANMVLVNGQCMNTVQLFGSCQFSQQCQSNSQCLSNICQCPTGSSVSNGVCTNGNNGNCGANMVLVNGQCSNTVQLFGSCQFSQQCLSNSKCLSNICQCPTGSSVSNGVCTNGNNGNCGANMVLVNNQCFPTVPLNSQCQFNQQCLSNSQCLNNFCQCAAGSSVINGVCSGGSSTNCQANQVLIGGQCYNTAQVGSSCTFNQQCLGNSQCLSNFCQCTSGSSLVNGQCTGGSSTCGANMVLINGLCFSTVQVGGTCQSTLQCLGNSQCTANFCTCPSGTSLQNGVCSNNNNGGCGSGMILIGNLCYYMVNIGGSCSYTQQCLSNSQCLGGSCACASGSSLINGVCSTNGGSCGINMVLINNQCFYTVSIGGNCQYNQQCLGNSQCTNNGICQCISPAVQQNGVCTTSNGGTCSSSQVNINGQCLPIVSIGQSCSSIYQCSVSSGQFQCQGTCQCQFPQSYNGTACVSTGNYCQPNTVSIFGSQCLMQMSIGQSCQYTQQCMGFSTCNGGTCACSNGYYQSGSTCVLNQNNNNNCNANQVLINGVCYNTVQIGGSCQLNQQCLGNSQCQNFVCQCAAGSTFVNGVCSGGSSNVCQTNQVLIGNLCYNTAQVGSSCTFNQQCLGNSQCLSNFCQCTSGSSLVNGQCTGGSSNCGANMVLIGGNCYNTVPIGGSCQFVQQCLGGSQCPSGICQCPYGTTNYGNGVCTGPSQNQGLTCQNSTQQVIYSNGQPFDCRSQSCPSGSQCQLNYAYQKYICCSSNAANNPSGATCTRSTDTIVLQNGSPINCLVTTCSSSAHCEYNNSLQQYVCCQPGSSNPNTGFNPTNSTSICTSGYQMDQFGNPFVCSSSTPCTNAQYPYCKLAPSQTFAICCNSP